jgi:hypothetical protein
MTRVSFEFNKKQTISILEMAESLGVSKAEVVRRALALLSVSVKEFRSGNSLASVKDGQIVKEIVTGLE